VTRVLAYLDGFNLYHGIRLKTGRRFLWLDVDALCRQILRPGDTLQAVKYFTTRVRDKHSSRHRQDAYLQALATHCPTVSVIEGRFQKQVRRCRACQLQWSTFEEKETDVNIAIALVEDAVLDRFDKAFLVSGDTDLVPAIRAVKRLCPEKRVVAVFPPARVSDPLRAAADAVYYLGEDKLRRAQLPAEVVTPEGIKLTRPAYWR